MENEIDCQTLLLCKYYEQGWSRRCALWALKFVYPTLQRYHTCNINFLFRLWAGNSTIVKLDKKITRKFKMHLISLRPSCMTALMSKDPSHAMTEARPLDLEPP